MFQISKYPDRDPIVRSNLYKLLSIGFRYPTPESFKIFQSGEYLDELVFSILSIPELSYLMPGLSLVAAREKNAMKGTTLPEFGMSFTQTFDIGMPVPSFSLYEGDYCGKPRSMIMLEVSEFYNIFGLRMNPEEGRREYPDHICAELEFLHFLTFKEHEALNEGKEEKLKGYVLAQKDFLELHMIQWIPDFSLKLQDSDVPFYAMLARIASSFITCEFKHLNI